MLPRRQTRIVSSIVIGGLAGAVFMLSVAEVLRAQTPPPQVALGSAEPLNISVQRPAKSDRDPNALYQFGEKAAVVEAPRIDLANKVVHFAAIKRAPTLRVDSDFEFRNYILHYRAAADERISGADSARPTREFADVACQIVGVKQ